MAKLARESKLRERRQNKEARKEARKLASSEQPDEGVLEFAVADGEQSDPPSKEAALLALREASDEKLEVFAARLQSDAFQAGASEAEIRAAQHAQPDQAA